MYDRVFDFSGGLNDSVSEFLLKDSELTEAVNVNLDTIGSIKKVPGYAADTAVGNNTPILGMYTFKRSDGTNISRLAAATAVGGATSVIYKKGVVLGSTTFDMNSASCLAYVETMDSPMPAYASIDQTAVSPLTTLQTDDSSYETFTTTPSAGADSRIAHSSILSGAYIGNQANGVDGNAATYSTFDSGGVPSYELDYGSVKAFDKFYFKFLSNGVPAIGEPSVIAIKYKVNSGDGWSDVAGLSPSLPVNLYTAGQDADKETSVTATMFLARYIKVNFAWNENYTTPRLAEFQCRQTANAYLTPKYAAMRFEIDCASQTISEWDEITAKAICYGTASTNGISFYIHNFTTSSLELLGSNTAVVGDADSVKTISKTITKEDGIAKYISSDKMQLVLVTTHPTTSPAATTASVVNCDYMSVVARRESGQAGSWNSLKAGLCSSCKTEFETFLDGCYIVNGTDATMLCGGTAGSETVVTNGNVTNAPIGKYIKEYKTRLYISGNSTYPNRVYYSSLPDSSDVITWTTASDYFTVPQKVTALWRAHNRLLIFSEHSLWRYDTYTKTQVQGAVGTTTSRSIANLDQYVFYYNYDGVYVFSGDISERISNKVQSYIDAIGSPADVVGWTKGSHYLLYVGNLGGDIGIDHAVLDYDFLANKWTVWSLTDEISSSCVYEGSNSRITYLGNDKSEIFEWDSGNSFASDTIHSYATTRSYDQGAPEFTKFYQGVYAFSKYAASVTLMYSIDDSDWVPLGNLDRNIKKFEIMERGHYIKFRFSESSTGTSYEIKGLTIVYDSEGDQG